VVTTETEAVERVRLGKETVANAETVSGEVRKEQVELDDPTAFPPVRTDSTVAGTCRSGLRRQCISRSARRP
jgi:hypothetical protein